MTLVSIGHRISILKYHDQVLELNGNGEWEVVSSEEYQARNGTGDRF